MEQAAPERIATLKYGAPHAFIHWLQRSQTEWFCGASELAGDSPSCIYRLMRCAGSWDRRHRPLI
jgi:hypothetical protein